MNFKYPTLCSHLLSLRVTLSPATLSHNFSSSQTSNTFDPDSEIFCPISTMPHLEFMTIVLTTLHTQLPLSSLLPSCQPGKIPALPKSNFPPTPCLHPSTSDWMKILKNAYGIFIITNFRLVDKRTQHFPGYSHKCSGQLFHIFFLITPPPLHFQLITNSSTWALNPSPSHLFKDIPPATLSLLQCCLSFCRSQQANMV